MTDLIDIIYDREKYGEQLFTHVAVNNRNELAVISETHIMIWTAGLKGCNSLPIVIDMFNINKKFSKCTPKEKINKIHHINNTVWVEPETSTVIFVYEYKLDGSYKLRIFGESRLLNVNKFYLSVGEKMEITDIYDRKVYGKASTIMDFSEGTKRGKILEFNEKGIFLFDIYKDKYTKILSVRGVKSAKLSPDCSKVAYTLTQDDQKVIYLYYIHTGATGIISINWLSYGWIKFDLWIYDGDKLRFSYGKGLQDIKLTAAVPQVALSTGELIFLNLGTLKYMQIFNNKNLNDTKGDNTNEITTTIDELLNKYFETHPNLVRDRVIYAIEKQLT